MKSIIQVFRPVLTTNKNEDVLIPTHITYTDDIVLLKKYLKRFLQFEKSNI